MKANYYIAEQTQTRVLVANNREFKDIEMAMGCRFNLSLKRIEDDYFEVDGAYDDVLDMIVYFQKV